jgi:hypothetical protein
MIASKLGALAALSLCLWSASAAADDQPAAKKQPAPAAAPAPVAKPAEAKPAGAKKGEITIHVKITGRRQVPSAAIDVARLVPRAPLPELRKPLVHRIGAAVDKAPF